MYNSVIMAALPKSTVVQALTAYGKPTVKIGIKLDIKF